jgi:YHS domain-containing protein
LVFSILWAGLLIVGLSLVFLRIRTPTMDFRLADSATLAGCEKRIQEDSRIRAAVDPVSGRAVDKAVAVIGAQPDGKVYYFESEGNLRKFRITPSS